jgi:hypothetical protein
MSAVREWIKRLGGADGQDAGGAVGGAQPPAQQAVEDDGFDIIVPFVKSTADGMASTTTADTKFFTNPFNFSLRVEDWVVNPDAAVAVDPTDYVQVRVTVDDGAAGAKNIAAEIDSRTGQGGGWSAGVLKRFFTRNAANCTILPGANAYFAIAKAGAGKVVPVSTYSLRLRKL